MVQPHCLVADEHDTSNLHCKDHNTIHLWLHNNCIVSWHTINMYLSPPSSLARVSCPRLGSAEHLSSQTGSSLCGVDANLLSNAHFRAQTGRQPSARADGFSMLSPWWWEAQEAELGPYYCSPYFVTKPSHMAHGKVKVQQVLQQRFIHFCFVKMLRGEINFWLGVLCVWCWHVLLMSAQIFCGNSGFL